MVEESVYVEAGQAPAGPYFDQQLAGTLGCAGGIDPTLQSQNQYRFLQGRCLNYLKQAVS